MALMHPYPSYLLVYLLWLMDDVTNLMYFNVDRARSHPGSGEQQRQEDVQLISRPNDDGVFIFLPLWLRSIK